MIQEKTIQTQVGLLIVKNSNIVVLNYKDTLTILENEILNVGDAVIQDKMLNLVWMLISISYFADTSVRLTG